VRGTARQRAVACGALAHARPSANPNQGVQGRVDGAIRPAVALPAWLTSATCTSRGKTSERTGATLPEMLPVSKLLPGRRCWKLGVPCIPYAARRWGRTVHTGPSSPVADLQRVDPAPWPPQQRSRSDAWLWSTSSPKSARRGVQVVTMLIARNSVPRASQADLLDPFELLPCGRSSARRSWPSRGP